ncbi:MULTISPECIES: Asp-tRNA(Asn)/Glu-tRNA(Gln) amidotransferase subunit GatB [unclassified Campylobacter]|uniref:Asp-tRNA(Asn)/Glu-tRNA(Gln) amidotransferase subunit GatB n=1 Tax=unclassified Campylobacter TaxID=2593542 RepID=UPI001237FE93|nr:MULTISPECIES: Asp-tRNA(Asn)/Glu-tRNA(Gln) amidotransferase subunit GatB [unclassified Campylobacter]KAA6224654.1 Asp-tRNA(Asn)/Glu-tRNA(Gln) amidotransferase subunit GatB [Campylobacter sp. LR185c]KAA6225654.1 Asp-tRNA(Asn)/Glu-tRNA(Gln) amidotransferase subunit GatB [Campylobacter sp. LR286c]KAA6225773.1 Asp-tRNA(Asn)/Glu-tRNA(Gln) amidotransferase subunit GatB [Campylobacter sp. LR196d]KAA6229627.1 Asp-tRNA(Asn)/Glu-tRNA(Gln) amidotransferase subunit GatB [Campylobacter sp. LR291e]KAA8604
MFEVVIGLEVHAQLNTKTKIFCACAISFGEAPNTNVCPTCLALPGALPVLNEEAVKKAVAFGKAINATINKKSIFNRKNYFYPDLPKAYQISQFDIPIVENGELFINLDEKSKRIGITRAHLEEDAGKNIHEGNHSKVDLNRSGTPLLEIVSEPDLRSSDEAVAYLKKLHAIIRFLDISDANMQEGSFRCDANVSIRPKGDTKLYTRVEIKNLNSFRFIQKAIDYEVKRQSSAWEDGTYESEIVQETRLFDTTKLVTRSMRGKEDSAEYRYFPDPDLLPVLLKDEFLNIKIPELPDEKKARYIREFNIKDSDASLLINSLEMSRFFEKLIDKKLNPKLCVTWLNTELMGLLKGELSIEKSPVNADKLGALIARIEDGTISGKAGKEVLAFIFKNTDASVDLAIEKLGLKQVSDDGAIEKIIDEILSKNADKVNEFKSGKDKLFGFFVGQVMKEGKGAFNPAKVNELLKAKLS